MPTYEKRQIIDSTDKTFSIEEQCNLVDLPRSTFYYSEVGLSQEDLAIMLRMDEMYLEDPTRSTRSYRSEFQSIRISIGRDRAQSLMQLMGIYAIYPKPRTTVINKTKYKYPYLLRGLPIERSNQVWEIDISYIPIRHGFMYLTAIIDVYSRLIVGWDISNTMESSWVVITLQNAIAQCGRPVIINSDRGTLFKSEEYVTNVKSLSGVRISMDGKGRATDNALVERFFRTIKHDSLYLKPSEDRQELFRDCEDFINYYNQRRSHSSIGMVPPAKVYNSA